MKNDKKGLLSNWLDIALDKKMRLHKIELLKRPGVNYQTLAQAVAVMEETLLHLLLSTNVKEEAAHPHH